MFSQVFELLSNLNPPLPNFSEANWTSSIRGAVTQHPDYSNMGSWNGREIADITYEDTEGVFTNFLIEKGYMEREPWYGMTGLKYLIEVKSTTRECSTPFFMSKEQYELVCFCLRHKRNGWVRIGLLTCVIERSYRCRGAR